MSLAEVIAYTCMSIYTHKHLWWVEIIHPSDHHMNCIVFFWITGHQSVTLCNSFSRLQTKIESTHYWAIVWERVIGGFSSQWASNNESLSTSWRTEQTFMFTSSFTGASCMTEKIFYGENLLKLHVHGHLPNIPLITATSWWARGGLKSPAYIFLLHRLFRRRSTKAVKLRVTGVCEGNSPVTGVFPAQRASKAENVSFDDVIMYLQNFFVEHSFCRIMT